MHTLSRITIYPIKSLDGHQVEAARVLETGALEHDRRYALVDGWGNYVNAKRFAGIQRIRASYSASFDNVQLECEGRQAGFSLASEQPELAQWCAEVLGLERCRLLENTQQGMPDDAESPGPTLISTASLQQVADWFGWDLEESRRRFRTNLEVSAEQPFWEDQLVVDRQRVLRFSIGKVVFQGRGVCQRCVVPTRDSHSGEADPRVAREFTRLRYESLPSWSPAERFDHYYRLAINTTLDEIGKDGMLRIGDPLVIPEDTHVVSQQ